MFKEYGIAWMAEVQTDESAAEYMYSAALQAIHMSMRDEGNSPSTVIQHSNSVTMKKLTIHPVNWGLFLFRPHQSFELRNTG